MFSGLPDQVIAWLFAAILILLCAVCAVLMLRLRDMDRALAGVCSFVFAILAIWRLVA